MKKILFVNGAEVFKLNGLAQGRLNQHIIDEATKILTTIRGDFEFQYTNVESDTDYANEVEKIVWADVVYYQTSVFWMGVPGKFKVWLDNTLSSSEGILYASDGRHRATPTKGYGTGGLCKNKYYFFSTTWNAPKEAFTERGEFFEGRSVDEIFIHFHKAQEFLGIQQIGSFHFHDIFKNPTLDKDLVALDVVLRKKFGYDYF